MKIDFDPVIPKNPIKVLNTSNIFKDVLNSIQVEYKNIKTTNFREILGIQSNLNAFHLKIELCSKVVESITSAFRRIQGGM